MATEQTLTLPDAVVEAGKEMGASENAPIKLSKPAIRSSLKASTLDGVFSAMFASITGGVLLSNFLLQLGATSVEIGMLSSFAMLVNFLQPLGAYWGDRTTSRLRYILWIFSPSRLLWLILIPGIWPVTKGTLNPHWLIVWTLGIVFITHVMGALGSPAWVAWMAVIVPRRLRGRYFGLRNSIASFFTLLSVPLLGWIVSAWPGGTLEGYGIVLLVGVVLGTISLGCQLFMADVNPQAQTSQVSDSPSPTGFTSAGVDFSSPIAKNFWWFLLYFGLWTFAVNISNPFFNLYLLDDLKIDVSWVTLYSSLTAGANLLLLLLWGRLSDRVGNRLILLLVGILVALTPVLWIFSSNDRLSLWMWLPLLHILGGGTWAAIDLCSGNIQMEVAPENHQASYFAIAAAVSGVCGAIGTTAGGFLAQVTDWGGLPGLFALSGGLRLLALIPLVLIREPHRPSFGLVIQQLSQKMRSLISPQTSVVEVVTAPVINRSK